MTTSVIEAPGRQYPWLLLLAVPVGTAICTVGVRLLLHFGLWWALPVFAGLMVFVTVFAGLVAWLLVERVQVRWRVACAIGVFAVEMALVVGVVAGLWEVLPLGFAGP